MSYLFYQESSCNPDIGAWDVSGVTTFYDMFYEASAFNQGACVLEWGVRDRGFDLQHPNDLEGG